VAGEHTRPSGRYRVTRRDWDRAFPAEEDERRHRERVQEAIRRHLTDLVREESILVASPDDGRRVVRIPVETLTEFRFRYGAGHQGGGTQAPGHGGDRDTTGRAGGSGPGIDELVETDVTLDEVEEVLLSALQLPEWDPNRRHRELQGGERAEALAHRGLAANLARPRTIQAALRHSVPGGRLTIRPDDLRYWRSQPAEDEQAGAVVLALMDTSGSMGSFEKFLARSFFYWTVRILRTRYPRISLVFLAHDVRAREVDEDTFFHRGASGGTVSSSVYRLALEVLSRYPAAEYNAYAFHFTDGGNLTSDNPQALQAGEALAGRVNLFGYGEIHDTKRHPSPLYEGFAVRPHTRAVVLRGREDVFRALVKFFGPDRGVGEADEDAR
jgi:sporulation protein YhbH